MAAISRTEKREVSNIFLEMHLQAVIYPRLAVKAVKRTPIKSVFRDTPSASAISELLACFIQCLLYPSY